MLNWHCFSHKKKRVGRKRGEGEEEKEKALHKSGLGLYKMLVLKEYLKERSPLSALIPKLCSPLSNLTSPFLVLWNLLSLLWTLLVILIPLVFFFYYYFQVEREDDRHPTTLFLLPLVSKCSLFSKSFPGSLAWMTQATRISSGGLVQSLPVSWILLGAMDSHTSVIVRGSFPPLLDITNQ